MIKYKFLLLSLSILIFREMVFAQNKIDTTEYKLKIDSSIILYLKIADFDSLKHKITKCPINEWNGVCLIDNSLVFGTDWEMPSTVLVFAYLIIDKQKVVLDASSMFNPFSGNIPDIKQFKLIKIEGGYLLRCILSDGAGAYEVEWKIICGKSIRTIISSDESLRTDFIDLDSK